MVAIQMLFQALHTLTSPRQMKKNKTNQISNLILTTDVHFHQPLKNINSIVSTI